MAAPVYLGVDFGTSHTAAVIQSAGTATPLLFDGSPLLPSAVFAETDGTLSVGRDAVHSVRLDPARFEPNPKRRVDDGQVLLGDREFGVIEMIAAVFTRVVEEYERVTGSRPGRATLTYPAAWGPARRLVLIDAAEKAGITSPKLVAEPVAAATHFADSQHVRLGSAVVVADFGGGTFDCSLVRRTGSGFDVVTSDGHDQLGGIDIDEAIVMHLRSQIDGDEDWARLSTPATPADRRHRRSFYDDVRSAKERLSRRQSADLYLPVFDRDIHLTREELETVARPLVNQAVNVTKAVIRISAVDNEDIAGLYLVGGGSRMPLVATMLHQATHLAPTVLEQPEMVVAKGAQLDSSPATRRDDPSTRATRADPSADPTVRGAQPSAPPSAMNPTTLSPPASTLLPPPTIDPATLSPPASSPPPPAVDPVRLPPSPSPSLPSPPSPRWQLPREQWPPKAQTATRTFMPVRLWSTAPLLLLQLGLTMLRSGNNLEGTLVSLIVGGLLISVVLLPIRHQIAFWMLLSITAGIVFLHWIPPTFVADSYLALLLYIPPIITVIATVIVVALCTPRSLEWFRILKPTLDNDR